MSDNEDVEWIAPADAEHLLWVPGSLLSWTSRERIIQRAREGFVRAHVRDLVKRTLIQPNADAKLELDERGAPRGVPLPIWKWPVEKERRSDVPLEEDDWLAPGLSDVTHSWWDTGDLELPATNGSREGISMFGIEFCKADIERMAPRPTPVAPMPAAQPAEPATKPPAGAAGDGTIRRAVEAYLARAPKPQPPLKTIAGEIQAQLAPASASRDRIVAIIKELSGPLRPGPR